MLLAGNGFPRLESPIPERSKSLLREVNHCFQSCFLCRYKFVLFLLFVRGFLFVSSVFFSGLVLSTMIVNIKELLLDQCLLFRKTNSYQKRVFYLIMLVFKLVLVKRYMRKERMHFRIGGSVIYISQNLEDVKKNPYHQLLISVLFDHHMYTGISK